MKLSRTMFLCLLALVVPWGCKKPTLPEGVYSCLASSDCPPGMQCHGNRCWSTIPSLDGGHPDAGRPDGGQWDGGGADGGQMDGGGADGGQVDGGGADGAVSPDGQVIVCNHHQLVDPHVTDFRLLNTESALALEPLLFGYTKKSISYIGVEVTDLGGNVIARSEKTCSLSFNDKVAAGHCGVPSSGSFCAYLNSRETQTGDRKYHAAIEFSTVEPANLVRTCEEMIADPEFSSYFAWDQCWIAEDLTPQNFCDCL